MYTGDCRQSRSFCKQANDLLLASMAYIIQPINYPTVPRGTERLRITPGPFHNARLIAELASAMTDIWLELGLPLSASSTSTAIDDTRRWLRCPSTRAALRARSQSEMAGEACRLFRGEVP